MNVSDLYREVTTGVKPVLPFVPAAIGAAILAVARSAQDKTVWERWRLFGLATMTALIAGAGTRGMLMLVFDGKDAEAYLGVAMAATFFAGAMYEYIMASIPHWTECFVKSKLPVDDANDS